MFVPNFVKAQPQFGRKVLQLNVAQVAQFVAKGEGASALLKAQCQALLKALRPRVEQPVKVQKVARPLVGAVASPER